MAAETLVAEDFGASKDAIDLILEENWDKDGDKLLEATTRALSRREDGSLARYYERFLGHSNIVIRIYGLRGIELNRMSQFRERLEQIAEKAGPEQKFALEALDALD
jgi:hypothetical protein